MRLRAGALLLIASLLGVVYPSALFAAHTLDTSARFPNDATTTDTTNPVSTTYTCGSGTTVFVVGIVTLSGTDRTGTPTYNGVNMLQAGTTQKAAASPEAASEIWYLIAPPTGSAYTVSVPNSAGAKIKLHMASFKAASGKGSALDVQNGCNNTSTNPTCSVTTTVNGDAVFGTIASGANAYSTATQNQTSLWVMDLGTQGSSAQYALQSTLGSITLSNTFGTSDDWGECIAAFKEISYDVALTTKLATSYLAPCTGGPGECVYVSGGSQVSLTTNLATVSQNSLSVEPKVVPLQTQLATASRGDITVLTDNATVSLTGVQGTGNLKAPTVFGPVMDAYVSVSLKGTSTDLKTGSPNLSITNGVATFDVAQTGNIGKGCKITYDTDKIAYISKVNSPTSFNVVTILGIPIADIGSVTVNSIKYTFSSLSDAFTNWSNEVGYTQISDTQANIFLNMYVYNNPGGTQQETVAGGLLLSSGNFDTANVTSTKRHGAGVIMAAGGEDSIQNNKHRGVLDTTNIYSLTSSTGDTMRVTVSWGKLKGLQLIQTGTTGKAVVKTYNQYAVNHRMFIEDNIMVSTSNSGTPNYGVLCPLGASNGSYVHVRNNLIYSSAAQKLSAGVETQDGYDSQVLMVYNNTIHNATYGVRDADPDFNALRAANNILSSTGANTACDGTLATGSGYNSTTDTDTGCGTGSYTSQTFTWASGTYMLASNDAGAKDKGMNDPPTTQSWDTTYGLSVDFTGESRVTDAWDIGFHEYAAKTVSPTTNLATVSTTSPSITEFSGYSVNLTTVNATAERGTILVTGQRDESVSLATKLATGERGTLTISGDSAVDLTTVAGTGQRGDLTVTAGADATLVTKLSTGERGTITVQSGADVPLTTVAGTGERGTLAVTVDQTVPLTTVLATGQRGTLDVSAGADVPLTTVAGTGQRGDINPNVGTYVLLTTVAGTSAITAPTFSSSGDVTLATKLATGERGNLAVTVDQSVALTTVAGTGERGTLDVSGGADVSLTTVNGTGQRGDLAVSGGASMALTTVAGTGQRGDITATGESTADINLTTVAGTGQRGTLTVTSGAQVDLTTVAGTSARGTLGVSAGATVALSTVLGTGQRGDLTVDWLVPSQNVDLTTQVATSSYGIISVYGGSSVALTGETATGQRGNLVTEGTSGATVALTTVSGTGQRGTIATSWYRDGNISFVGSEAPSLTGDITPKGDAAIGLTGEVMVAYAGDIAVRRSSFRPWWPMPGGVVGTGGLVR